MRFSLEEGEASKYKVFALLSSIIPLELDFRSLQAITAIPKLVHSHGLTVDEVKNNIIKVTQWSEPICAWAAINLLGGGEYWGLALRVLLWDWIKPGLIDSGRDGELTGRIILGYTFANCQTVNPRANIFSFYGTKLDTGRWIKVREVLQTLLHDRCEEQIGLLPQEILHAYTTCNHFTKIDGSIADLIFHNSCS